MPKAQALDVTVVQRETKFLALVGLTTALCGVCIEVVKSMAWRNQKFGKNNDAVMLHSPVAAIRLLWVLLIAMLAPIFLQFAVCVPRAGDSVRVNGCVDNSVIKVHRDSGTSRHFIPDCEAVCIVKRGRPENRFQHCCGHTCHFRATGNL